MRRSLGHRAATTSAVARVDKADLLLRTDGSDEQALARADRHVASARTGLLEIGAAFAVEESAASRASIGGKDSGGTPPAPPFSEAERPAGPVRRTAPLPAPGDRRVVDRASWSVIPRLTPARPRPLSTPNEGCSAGRRRSEAQYASEQHGPLLSRAFNHPQWRS